MRKEQATINQGDPIKLFGMIAPYLPNLLIRSGSAWLSFKRQASKGGREFKKELIRQGVDKQTVELLTKQYLESSILLKYFKNVE